MSAPATRIDALDLSALAERIKAEARALGFQAVHIGSANSEAHRPAYEDWLAKGYNGDMKWMERNLDKRFDGAQLHPGTERAISVRLDYRPEGPMQAILDDPNKAYISAGSWFFLGELFTNLPLPIDPPFETEHCGSCDRCMTACPTDAFVAEGVLDARRCISYLTIEHSGSIDPELRPLMGNRIYGCDDCQIVCPFNSFSQTTQESDFEPRHNLDQADLLTLFQWSEAEFLDYTEGSAIRRIGYQQWLRNLAVALGNAPTQPAIIEALSARREAVSDLVREHIDWALERHGVTPPA